MKTMIVFFLLVLIGCGKETKKKSSVEKQDVSPLFKSSRLVIKVYYEEGSEPYTDKLLGMDLWTMFQVNVEALVQGRNIAVNVPKSLAEMIKLTPQNKTTWSGEEIISLSETYKPTIENNTTHFQIFFVGGRSKDSPNVIGFHLSHTRVIAIFKEVINSSGTGQLGFVPRYVEQATLIHEMGHAMGLVNNGVPMTSDHQDSQHGAHCTNENCVMYYQNEGLSSLINYAKNSYAKGSTIMFDNLCLEDTKNYQK